MPPPWQTPNRPPPLPPPDPLTPRRELPTVFPQRRGEAGTNAWVGDSLIVREPKEEAFCDGVFMAADPDRELQRASTSKLNPIDSHSHQMKITKNTIH